MFPYCRYDSNSYSDIKFVYNFARKPSYCVITAILPCVMIMIIVLSSYLLPPNCGERIGVLITAILAFTVFLQVYLKLKIFTIIFPQCAYI